MCLLQVRNFAHLKIQWLILTPTSIAIFPHQDWTLEEVKEIYDMPLMELVYKAATTHRMFFDPTEVSACCERW